MVVHFIASKSNIIRDYQYYKIIIDSVRELGHEIARDWVQPEYELVTSGHNHSSIDWQTVNKENMQALSRSDVIIAEASAKNFSTGLQVATAIQQKKPVLILTRNNELAESIGGGIDSDFVKTQNYTTDSVRDIIADFIFKNNIDNKDLRFNFFIDRKIYNYLRWASYRTGKNKSEILRELVLREIEKEEN